MWFKSKPAPKQLQQIAQIEEHITPTGGGAFASLMLVLPVIPMLFAIVVDSSAIRLAAYGALWTGWNVLWGVVVLIGQRRTYVVVRELPTDPQAPNIRDKV